MVFLFVYFFFLQCSFFQYAVLLFLLLIAQIVVGVLMFTNKHDLQQIAGRELNKLWHKRHQPRIYQFWDGLQTTVRI